MNGLLVGFGEPAELRVKVEVDARVVLNLAVGQDEIDRPFGDPVQRFFSVPGLQNLETGGPQLEGDHTDDVGFIVDDQEDPSFHKAQSDCLPCETDTFSDPGARYCRTCPAGKHVNDTLALKTCSPCAPPAGCCPPIWGCSRYSCCRSWPPA